MGESRIPPPAGGQDFVNPLSADVTQGPLMPRIMEMDILRRTQPDTLLGETSFQCRISADRIINIP